MSMTKNHDATAASTREVYKLPMGWYWIDHAVGNANAVGPFLTREDAELDARLQVKP